MNKTNSRTQVITLICVLLAGLALRIWNFPARYEVRDSDELGYTYGGLLLWEGITPGYKMSPAGFQTWVGWIYCGCKSLINLASRQEGAGLPAALRPFHAVEKALFDTYRDSSALRQLTVVLIILISLAGIYAAFRTGFHRAGTAGGLLSGGLAALLPVFVQASGMAKPYVPAWSFAIIAHYFAATKTGKARWIGSAIFMGLAVSSRIEILLFFPIILWEIWQEKEPEGFRHTAVRLTSLMVIVTLLVSPWLLTNLLGNLRVIATVRFSAPSIRSVLGPLFKDFTLLQGLGPVAVLTALGLAAAPAEKRRAHWLLLFILLILFLTMFKPTPYGIRHHGATIVALAVTSSLALARFRKLSAAAAGVLSALLLIIPAINAASAIAANRQSYVPDQATAWIEKHVKPGSRIYLCPTLNDPLPTQESADSLWAAVTDNQSWRTKFKQALSRYNLPEDRITRALSQENLIQEQGNRRRWFILGAKPEIDAPRFDIKIISGGSPFDITPEDALKEYMESGGVLILRQSREPQFLQPGKELGVPKASWTSRKGKSTLVYYTPQPAFPTRSQANGHSIGD